MSLRTIATVRSLVMRREDDNMTIRLVDDKWHKEMTNAAKINATELRIICPFIKTGALDRLLLNKWKTIQVITRFSLKDFAKGVSDIEALRKLLDAGAHVRGVRNLHAKLYMFGAKRAIVTSANLTEAALNRNHEFGLVAESANVISECQKYFNELWHRSGCDLSRNMVDDWEKTITWRHTSGGQSSQATDLRDFGTDIGIPKTPISLPVGVADAQQAFVKFGGTAGDRAPLSISTLEEIKSGGCHWAVCYPKNQRPRIVQDGSLIFIARLTTESNKNDIRVFGCAIGMKYIQGRDDATPEDKKRRSWKAKWPHYIRVHQGEFIAGTIANGVSLSQLMDELEADSFQSTQHNATRGEGNTNPRKAIRQKPAVQLSSKGRTWLAERLQEAFEVHGRVPKDTLDGLDWPDVS